MMRQKETRLGRFNLFRSFGPFRKLPAGAVYQSPVKKGRWTRRVLITLVFSLAIILVLFFALPQLLIAPAIATKSDIIIHGSISPQSTANEYVADLYKQGLARKVVIVSSQVSWNLYPGDYARDRLIALGVPAEDVISMRLPIVACGALNLTTIVGFVKTNGWRSAILITHPEDSRYAARLSRSYFEREGISTSVSYSPRDKEELTRNWWREHSKTQRMVGEVMNVTLDMFYSECR
jgi:uncharacterized SAM-binding protein YcdF (DUF218 family)